MRATWLVALAVAAAACDEEESNTCAVPNAELSPVAVVVDNGAKIRAEIDFERGDRTSDPDPLEICSDETLTIAGKKPTVTTKADRVVYSVTLPADADRTIDFSLVRSGDNDDLTLSVPVPPAFEITMPLSGWQYRRGDVLSVAWEPPQDGRNVRISLEEDIGYGVCVLTPMTDHAYKDEGGIEIPDQGTWTMPEGSVDSMVPQPCRAFLTLKRIAFAEYPSGLAEGGFLEARVQRTVEFQSLP